MNESLSAADVTLANVTAAMLRASGILWWLSCGVATISAVLLDFGPAPIRLGMLLAESVALASVLPAAWLTWRIRFDAELFAALAQNHEPDSLQSLDTALDSLGLRKGRVRSLADRARGARGLVLRLSGLVLLQVLILLWVLGCSVIGSWGAS